jgi:hypothetical protein
MQTLRQLVDRIDTNRSNLNGSCSSFDNLTIQDLFQCSEPKIYEIIELIAYNVKSTRCSKYQSPEV